MIGLFNKPIPFVENLKHRLLISFFLSLFIYGFLITFQPFGISNIQYNKFFYLGGFFGITLFVMLILFAYGPLLFKSFFNFDKWTIGKNTVLIVLILLAISVLNWFYNMNVGFSISEQHNLGSFIAITIAIGIIPTIFLIVVIERMLYAKNEMFASNFTDKLQSKSSEAKESVINIKSKNKQESFTIDIQNLICLKAEGNYLNIYFIENKEVKKKLIRNSISSFEKESLGIDVLKRCHRSFIVNLDKVSKMTGNARNLNLHIKELDFSIPVSRTFPKKIVENWLD